MTRPTTAIWLSALTLADVLTTAFLYLALRDAGIGGALPETALALITAACFALAAKRRPSGLAAMTFLLFALNIFIEVQVAIAVFL